MSLRSLTIDAIFHFKLLSTRNLIDIRDKEATSKKLSDQRFHTFPQYFTTGSCHSSARFSDPPTLFLQTIFPVLSERSSSVAVENCFASRREYLFAVRKPSAIVRGLGCLYTTPMELVAAHNVALSLSSLHASVGPPKGPGAPIQLLYTVKSFSVTVVYGYRGSCHLSW